MLAQHGGMKRMDWFPVGRDLFKGGRTGFGWFQGGKDWFRLVPLFSNYPRTESIEKIKKPTATIRRRTSSEANLKYISSNLHRTIE